MPSSTEKSTSLAVPAETVGSGLIPGPGAKFRLRVGDRFVACNFGMLHKDRSYVYCEVREKEGSKVYCQVINGGWALWFNASGIARHGPDKRELRICLLLPKRLRGVRSMKNYDRVLEVAEKLVEAAAKNNVTA